MIRQSILDKIQNWYTAFASVHTLNICMYSSIPQIFSLTRNQLNFLYRIIHLPFLESSIIILRDIKVGQATV